MDRRHLAELDAADPLARFRARFSLPDGLIYLDGKLAEAMQVGKGYRHPALRRMSRTSTMELGARWRRNMLLNKWLDYLVDQGHLVLER